MTHAGKIVTVIPENNSFRLVIDGDTVAVVPRTTSREIDRLQGLRHPLQKGGDPMPEVKLDVTDAAELAEMLQFLSQWLARDPARLGASLEEFVGHPAYGISQLRQRPGPVCLPARRQRRRAALRPMTGASPGPAGTPAERPSCRRCWHVPT